MEHPFDIHFTALYGERFQALKNAMLGPKNYIGLQNLSNETQIYYLDHASFQMAKVLPLKSGARVLDMCAAPGGKSLVLFYEMMQVGLGELIANEVSQDRRLRLLSNLKTYIPENLWSHFKVTGKNAETLGLFYKNQFDSILLDAPCSSERHLLEHKKELNQWTLSRSKHLAMRQYALLCSGLMALKPGGHLLYSTCSISPLENDGVIEKLMRKNKHSAEVIFFDLENGERTTYGCQIWPDKALGAGPLYGCLLVKKA